MQTTTFNPELTTNQNLAAFGLTKRPVGKGYQYEYLRGDVVAFRGNLQGVNEWMAAGCPAQVEE